MKHEMICMEPDSFLNQWITCADFLKSQLESICRQSNSERNAMKRLDLDERAQNIRRVLVDMGEMDKSAL